MRLYSLSGTIDYNLRKFIYYRLFTFSFKNSINIQLYFTSHGTISIYEYVLDIIPIRDANTRVIPLEGPNVMIHVEFNVSRNLDTIVKWNKAADNLVKRINILDI